MDVKTMSERGARHAPIQIPSYSLVFNVSKISDKTAKKKNPPKPTVAHVKRSSYCARKSSTLLKKELRALRNNQKD